ncbi:MAG: hypothetical protein QOI24_2342 [Acidobacteriota bacterium]|jgi:hypothetical protein|nr:hypothetical protein [Acidobacteriota bacterium]
MSSNANNADPFAGIDFERDVTITAADLEALARARELRPLSAEEYQEWVDLIHRHHPATRPEPSDDEPFTLPI